MKLTRFKKPANILQVLNDRFYLQNVVAVSDTEFKAEISLNIEAMEVLFSHLTDSVKLTQALDAYKNYTTEVVFDFKENDIHDVLEELDFAYQKTVCYLDSRDLYY